MAYHFDQLKVLVVDDNQHMRMLMGTILRAFGIKTVYVASNQDEAWNVLTLNPCDIIFADWVLDSGSGLELTQKVRTAPNSPNAFVPIIMLTGHTSVERVHMARDAGVNEFLAKPVSSRLILTRLVAVIEHPRPFVRTKNYFGPCRRRRKDDAYHGPERRLGEGAGSENTNTKANAA